MSSTANFSKSDLVPKLRWWYSKREEAETPVWPDDDFHHLALSSDLIATVCGDGEAGLVPLASAEVAGLISSQHELLPLLAQNIRDRTMRLHIEQHLSGLIAIEQPQNAANIILVKRILEQLPINYEECVFGIPTTQCFLAAEKSNTKAVEDLVLTLTNKFIAATDDERVTRRWFVSHNYQEAHYILVFEPRHVGWKDLEFFQPFDVDRTKL